MIVIRLSGGLGNQLFQYAAGASLGQKLGKQVSVDLCLLKRNWQRPYFLESIVGGIKIVKSDGISRDVDTVIVSEENYRDVYDNGRCEYNYYLNGYFQSERYFAEHSEYIKNIYRMHESSERSYKDNAVAVHVRKGDYVKNNKTASVYGGVCNAEYYRQAMELAYKLHGDIMYDIYTDDHEWVMKSIPMSENIRIVGERKSAPKLIYNAYVLRNLYRVFRNKHASGDVADFNSMRGYSAYIISNSTYGWWASWLSNAKRKTIITPRIWKKEAMSTLLTTELFTETEVLCI